MTSTFPSVLNTYTDPLSTDRLNNPSHSGIETNQNSGLKQVEAVIGVEGASSVVGSLQYVIKSPASNGGGHVQTAAFGGTGQTTYAKGNLLVGASASVLSKLVVGNDGAVLKSNSSVATGVEWGAVPGIPTVRIYQTASTLAWVKPSVLSYIVVEVLGAGGGGAGTSGSGNTHGGSGGSAGAWARKVYSASVLGATETVVIGSAGTAGSTTTSGGVGGASSFSTGAASVKAAGGNGGNVGSSGAPVPGVVGGVASGGDINATGGPSGPGTFGAVGLGYGGWGGNSPYGGGGITQEAEADGNPATGFGSGGGGGFRNTTSKAGGVGTVGQVIIYEY